MVTLGLKLISSIGTWGHRIALRWILGNCLIYSLPLRVICSSSRGVERSKTISLCKIQRIGWRRTKRRWLTIRLTKARSRTDRGIWTWMILWTSSVSWPSLKRHSRHSQDSRSLSIFQGLRWERLKFKLSKFSLNSSSQWKWLEDSKSSISMTLMKLLSRINKKSDSPTLMISFQSSSWPKRMGKFRQTKLTLQFLWVLKWQTLNRNLVSWCLQSQSLHRMHRLEANRETCQWKANQNKRLWSNNHYKNSVVKKL